MVWSQCVRRMSVGGWVTEGVFALFVQVRYVYIYFNMYNNSIFLLESKG